MEKVEEMGLPKGRYYCKGQHVHELGRKDPVRTMNKHKEEGYLYYVKDGDLYRSKMKSR